MLLALIIIGYLNLDRISRGDWPLVRRHERVFAPLAGVAGGIFEGTVNVAVPPLIIFYLALELTPAMLVQALNICFLVGKSTQLAVLTARGGVTARAGTLAPTPSVAVSAPAAAPEVAGEPIHRRAARYAWALLLARIYEVFPLICPKCGDEMRIIAFITEAVTVRDILAYLGDATSPPRLMPARDPPLWKMPDAGQDEFDPQAQLAPDYEFDQRIAW